MELDRAFQLALIASWEDLQDAAKTRSLRLEYEKEPKTELDHLSVWADQPKGYQYLIYNFKTNPPAACFANGYHSDRLAQSLNFIMANQAQFTHPSDAGRYGLVLTYPPATKDLEEAASWTKAIDGAATRIENAALKPSVPSLAGL